MRDNWGEAGREGEERERKRETQIVRETERERDRDRDREKSHRNGKSQQDWDLRGSLSSHNSVNQSNGPPSRSTAII